MLALTTISALGSFEAIYNYVPNSKVTPHNAIDLDQRDMEAALSATTVDYASAKNVYLNGAHSKSYSEITYTSTTQSTPAFTTAATCTGTTSAGDTVSGVLKSAVSATPATSPATSVTIKCIYPTSNVQATFCGCQVGSAYPTSNQVTTGCLNVAADVTIAEGATSLVMAAADMVSTEKNGRTLYGFGKSSTMTSKLYVNSNSCPGCPYRDYVKFYNFYGAHGHSDDIVQGALDGTAVQFASTPLAPYVKDYDFTTYSDDETRTQVIKKTTAYMSVWMYTVREFEDAIDDCEVGNAANNDGSVHAWDEGVAFYTGSLEGTDGSGSGKLIAALADKRCENFGTCSGTDGISGTSNVNTALLTEFQAGRNELIVFNCAAVRPILTRVVSLMSIPLIQGTLRYAYKMGVQGPAGANSATAATMNTYNAEGVVFASAILPLVASCSSGAAKTIWEAMTLGAGSATSGTPAVASFNKDAVKAAFEANYACLGVTCADIGALNTAGGLISADAATWGVPCNDASTGSISDVAYERIAGYLPRSKVTDHNAVDLDQAAMESQLGLTGGANYVTATAIYTNGGNSKSYARFTVPGTDTNGNPVPAIPSGTAVLGMSTNGVPINGVTKSAISASATTIDVYYATNTVQANYNGGCQVGSLVTAQTRGCFPATGRIVVGWTSIDPTAVVNLAARSIQGFATTSTVTSKMWSGCPGCPYKTFAAFYAYYGDLDYADKWVSAALAGTSLTYTNGQVADFATYNADKTRVDAAKKGSAFMNVWMYVIREFEDAIDDCSFTSIDNNYGSAHAWDEGVAFYTGSLEGTDGSGSGKMPYALADKRCVNYGTCLDTSAVAHGGSGSESHSGTSKVNGELFALFAQGQSYLHGSQCGLVRPVLNRIIQLMSIPLIQGTLRYAYKMGANGPAGSAAWAVTSDSFLKSNAEGAAFAFAVLPLVNNCSAADATIIYNAMKLGGDFLTVDSSMAVKEAFERNYPCLGIVCADIGGLNVAGGLLTAGDAFGVTCTDPGPTVVNIVNNVTRDVEVEVATMSGGAIVGIIAAAVVAVIFCMFILFMYSKERAGQPVFTPITQVKSAA